ncbi:bifunctional aminoglycoside phosphotransferase/ATP-binding protein [Rhodoferax sp.]|uniref:bifunctional aminoglycoside phosphotransferase/ATP-binding protein n=1 Tax=Rhodoferax sp. TaxID=50421 RepID=UPI0025D5AD4A|nr:bifunctional aminoglycoside phosphotransferase/ATP-binding protein [Rhodoferax sp.]
MGWLLRRLRGVWSGRKPHAPGGVAKSGIIAPMDDNLPPLIQALLEPKRYPGAVGRVELVQTHISWVLLAGDFAYKIKKPVKLSFLDFSTLALRQRYCESELRLNRRFAPDLYLEVLAIGNTPQDPQWGASSTPIEYAVKMRRFDEAGRLDHVCARGELLPRHLSDLADTVSVFHLAAAVAPPNSPFGAPPQVIGPMRDNFDALLEGLPTADLPNRLKALRAWTEAQFAQLTPLLQTRKQAGWVRECHGDLHLANLVLIDERVRMFDGIEFSDRLRWIDLASEVAFTYVDLLAHQQPGLADWFINEYLSRTGDYEAAALLHFYGVYRAMVRAKVAAIRTRQTQNAGREALAYIALAERLMTPPAARLVITHGLSGCGKTVASNHLLLSDAHASTLRLRSDVERKRLFGLSSSERSGATLNQGIYALDAHGRTYDHLGEQARRLLRAGWSVIVDATFLRRVDRDAFRALARACDVAFSILAPQATPKQLRERILARHALGQDASEATLDVLAQQLATLEPLEPEEVPEIEPARDF